MIISVSIFNIILSFPVGAEVEYTNSDLLVKK